jgi:hypothetical protein
MNPLVRRLLMAALLLSGFNGPEPGAVAQARELRFQGDATAVATAQQLGFPPVPRNAGVIGPFTDAYGLAYLNQKGLVSYFSPQQLTVYFAALDAGGTPQIRYALTPTASYVVEAGQARGVHPTAIESRIAAWPYSGAMVNVLIASLQRYQAQIQTGATGTLSPAEHSYVSGMLHNTSMGILDNIGSQGCTEHYEDVYYLGCW